MKRINKITEEEIILEFLKGEFNSNRFNEDLRNALIKLNLNSNIISNGDLTNKKENLERLKIMKEYRGYPDEELFENFPTIYEWDYVKLSKEDIDKIYYIDYDYWNELSNNTSKPLEAAKTIKEGREIFKVSNQPFIDGIKNIDSFPPIILITCNDEKYLIIEGHSRMTVYGLNPDKLEGTYAYIGYCTEEEMKKYDIRMLKDESLKSRKY